MTQHAMNPQSKIFPREPAALFGGESFLRQTQAREALALLVAARDLLKAVGAKRTVERVRLAISSARGAVRHAPNRVERSK